MQICLWVSDLNYKFQKTNQIYEDNLSFKPDNYFYSYERFQRNFIQSTSKTDVTFIQSIWIFEALCSKYGRIPHLLSFEQFMQVDRFTKKKHNQITHNDSLCIN